MANGNGVIKSIWGIRDTVKLLSMAIVILLTILAIMIGKFTLTDDVQALETRVETNTVETINIKEDVKEMKEDIRIIREILQENY